MKTGLLFGLAALALVGAMAVASRVGATPPPREADDAARAFLDAHETELRDYAGKVRAAAVAKLEGTVTYPPPPVPAAAGDDYRILNVTADANGNVYFISNRSAVMFNTGLVYRNGNAPLLGDQQEAHLTHHERLREDWWLYVAR